MPSNLVKKVEGTLIEDQTCANIPPLVRWVQFQCRYGVLREAVQKFCAEQSEPLNPALLVVECVSADGLVCTIPCRCLDHETRSPFSAEVKFKLDPVTGAS